MYPTHLLPDITYLIITDIEAISHHFMGKYVETDAADLTDNTGKLDISFIERKRIPGFSMNKIPESIQNDLNLKIQPGFEYHNDDWMPGDSASVPALHEFQVVTNHKHYYLPIGEIHNYTDKYFGPNENDNPSFEFRVKVVHRPTKCNYWHFELHLSSPDHEIMANKGAWRKAIHSAIADRISEIAIFTLG